MAIGIYLARVNAAQGVGHPAGHTATPSPKLVRAAHEFEGMMLKELLKPMTAGNGLTGDDGDGDDSGSSGVLGEFAGEALGQGISQQGGFGIADRIVAQLSHSGNALKNGKVTEKMHSDTVMGATE